MIFSFLKNKTTTTTPLPPPQKKPNKKQTLGYLHNIFVSKPAIVNYSAANCDFTMSLA